MSENELNIKEFKALHQIRNFIMQQGRMPSVRELMRALGYRSPRSALVFIHKLVDKGFLEQKTKGGFRLLKDIESSENSAQTVNVPLVGSVSCGMPIFAEENIEANIPVSTNLTKGSHKYFFLRARGDSMDKKGINNGDLVLIRQQSTAENGDIVVALIDNETTIKKFVRSNDAVILKPMSSNPAHVPIVLTNNFLVQGIVVLTIPNEI